MTPKEQLLAVIAILSMSLMFVMTQSRQAILERSLLEIKHDLNNKHKANLKLNKNNQELSV